jgi:iron complex outermembrane receptor protein
MARTRLHFVLLALALVVSALSLPVQAHAQVGTIVGKVVDKEGQPLAGVAVVLVGQNRGGQTTPSGEYKIPGVPVGTYVVRAMLIGYERREARVQVDANRAPRFPSRLAPTCESCPMSS